MQENNSMWETQERESVRKSPTRKTRDSSIDSFTMDILEVMRKDAEQNNYVYDEDNKTINGLRYTDDDITALCLFKCYGRLKTSKGNWYIVRLRETNDLLSAHLIKVATLPRDIDYFYAQVLKLMINNELDLPCLHDITPDSICANFVDACEMRANGEHYFQNTDNKDNSVSPIRNTEYQVEEAFTVEKAKSNECFTNTAQSRHTHTTFDINDIDKIPQSILKTGNADLIKDALRNLK